MNLKNNIFLKLFTTVTLTSSLVFASVDGYMTTMFINGDGSAGGDAGTHGTVKFYPTPTTQNEDISVIKDLATHAQTGAVWGMAYDKVNKIVYVSAAIKRHIGLGNLGTGGIYKIDISDIDNPVVTEFTTISNTGTIPSNSARNLPSNSADGSTNEPSKDPIFDQVAKMGLGDLDISTDGTKLYTVNLNTQSLIEIDIASKSQTVYAIGNPFGDCDASHVRPWAINTQNSEVHIGAVCDNDLSKGSVVAILQADGTFSAIAKQSLEDNNRDDIGSRDIESADHGNYVYNWLDSTEETVIFGGGAYPDHPQLVLSDIEFDKDNDLILGFLDRSGLQVGFKNYAPDASNDMLYNLPSGGDIQKMCYSGGIYYTEGTAECPFIDDNEFFVGDAYRDNRDPGNSVNHYESSLGGLAYDKSTNMVGLSVYDPVNSGPTFISGAAFLNNSTGVKETAQNFLLSSNRGMSSGKAGGVGDMEMLETISTFTLGNYVWLDENEDGVQDASESGVNGVTANLYSTVDCSGTITETITTANGGTTSTDGFYEFTNLVEGDYCVEFTNLPTDHVITKNTGADDATNSDVNVDGKIENITLTADNPDEDMGIYLKPIVSIGSLIWEDLNNDGLQDDGERGIADVNVTLLDENGTVMSNPIQKTEANGQYYFSGLDEGSYSVLVSPPTGMGYVACATQNTADDDNTENDSNIKESSGNEYTSGKFTLQVGTEPTESNGKLGTDTADDLADENGNMTVDFCFYRPASLGDYVWYDDNKDGIQDARESGVQGVTVKLLKDCSSATIAGTATTDIDGKYLFSNLDAGDYCVEFSNLPTDFMTTSKDSGDGTNDSDTPLTAPYKTASTTLDAGEEDLTWDMGIYSSKAAIGDIVWYDLNSNGQQDAGENGVNGLEVKLLDETCTNELNTTNTDANGNYTFESLTPGKYCLEFATAPAGYAITTQNSGDDSSDSDVDPVTRKTIQTTLDEGERDLTWDMGIYPLAEIGNKVWADNNADGIQDAGELGVPAVTVTLFGADCLTVAKGVEGTDVPTTTTDGTGEYLFKDLPVGSYCVGFTNIPDGYTVSPKNRGGDTESDSDVNDLNKTTVTSLDANESDMSWDMGIYKPATLGDIVWNDTNANGIQDAGEVGVENVTVILYDNTCNTIAVDVTGANIPTQQTDTNGNYLFTELMPADYCVGFTTLPAGYAISPQEQGTDDTKNSDVNITTAKTKVTTLDPGEDDRTWDMGIYQEASIGNYVWNDANANGEQESSELPVENVTVTLYDADCTTVAKDSLGADIPVELTDANGLYLFDHLMPAEYCLGFTTLPSGFGVTFEGTVADEIDSDVITSSMKTISTVLDAGENDMTWDMGIFQSSAIGDTVWYDNNANGIQDAGETGVENVTVNLYKTDCSTQAIDGVGVAIPATQTDANGKYAFTSLVPNDYCVGFDVNTLPAGYKVSPQNNSATTEDKDSDADETTGITASTNLVGGENDITWDMGIYSPASLGNYVWLDNNADGIQDSNESGVENVEVTLYDATCNTAVTVNNDGGAIVPVSTDVNGKYNFTNLIPSEYCVGFTLPNGYMLTTKNTTDDTLDSDVNANLKTDVMTLESGENNITLDMGIYKPASIGNVVWYDNNADGIQDSNESMVQGVEVTLYDGTCTNIVGMDNSGVAITVQTTDVNGEYNFTNLTPGSYCVGFDKLPADYKVTEKDSGANDELDSDVDPVSKKAIGTVLDSGENDLSWDMGIYKPASIGNVVWNDLNADGIQDSGEVGVPEVTVTLYGSDCTTVAVDENGENITTVNTDASGNYTFTNLVPNNYCVGFSNIPNIYTISPENSGSDDEVDSDVNPTTAKTTVTTLESGENDPSWDMGIYESTSIGDTVWYDTNANGIQDAGETGVENVAVNLYESDCVTAVATVPATQTDVNGKYAFTSLVPNDYCVGFDVNTLPAGYKVSPQNVTATEATDSDADETTGITESTNLVGGANDTTWDMGIYIPASLGDRVWLDENANGVQNDNETGVKDVTVTLYDNTCTTAVTINNDGGAIVPVITDNNGNYIFTNLVPAEYCVGFTDLPANHVVSPKDATTEDKDSDVNPATLKTDVTTLVSGENDPTWDMGIYVPASIGNYVWLDENGNGVQDDNETAVENVAVTLYEGDCATVVTRDDSGADVSVVKTGANGEYNFTNLTPNEYCVGFDVPLGYVVSPKDVGTDNNDSDVNPATSKTDSTTLSSGENDPTWDMGIYKPATIGNVVWNDLNGNGEQEDGEMGVEDVTVTLYNCDCTTVATDNNGAMIPNAVTDVNGVYSFTDLRPNDYCVGFTVPTGYVISPQSVTADDTKDSDVNVDTNVTKCTTLSSDENDTTWDMGIYEPASIGDRVWYDTNRDGVQDSGETGVVNALVTLYAEDGNVVSTTNTDEDGNFLFDALVPNNYLLGFEVPNGYALSDTNRTNDNNDSDVNPATSRTELTNLESGESDISWDAGIYQLSSLGDKVWYDENHNGIQDTDEPAVKDIKVVLYESDCTTVIAETRSDSNGEYLFSNLEPKEYCVGFEELPVGYQFTPNYDNTGAGSELDCNVDPGTGKTPVITLPHATDDRTWDMGIIPKCKDEEDRVLRVFDDNITASTTGSVTTINILANDHGNLDIESIRFVSTEEGAILWENGTAVGGTNLKTTDKLVVEGEGNWSITNDGTITFSAEDGFTGVPTPVYYIINCKQGDTSNVGQVNITSNCVCDTYEESLSDSVPVFSKVSMILVLALTSLLGMFFFRRELQEIK